MPKGNEIKRGSRTTEFWLALAAMASGAALMGIATLPSVAPEIGVRLIATGQELMTWATVGYMAARGLAKLGGTRNDG